VKEEETPLRLPKAGLVVTVAAVLVGDELQKEGLVGPPTK
jgi:hypothetical protein